MARPSVFPRWATGGTAAIAAPSSPEQDVGHLPQTILTAQLANWLQNLVYQWLVYLDGATAPLTTTVTPSAANATAAAAIGTSPESAHADHVHSIPTASPVAIQVGASVIPGTAATLARSDHGHGVTAGTPVALTVGGTNSAGSATSFPRSDHVHGMPGFGAGPSEICRGTDSRLFHPSRNGLRLSGSVTDPITPPGTYTTLYLTAYLDSVISMYITVATGLVTTAGWYPLVITAGAGPSIALTGMTAGVPQDVFAYASTLTVVSLEILPWTNATTRATALVQQDGVWVKSGSTTRRYVGTILPASATQITLQNAGSGTTRATCPIWNANNRVWSSFGYTFTAATYAVGTASTWIALPGTDARLDFVQGLPIETMSAQAYVLTGNAAAGNEGNIGFMQDAALTTPVGLRTRVKLGAAEAGFASARLDWLAPIGARAATLAVLSNSTAQVYYGFDGGALQSGLYAECCW